VKLPINETVVETKLVRPRFNYELVGEKRHVRVGCAGKLAINPIQPRRGRYAQGSEVEINFMFLINETRR